MAGTIRGRIESFVAAGENGTNEAANAQVFFKNIYDVFNSHPNATLVALQYGSGTYAGFTTGGGGGTDYYDGAAPFESNAFFVFRMNTSGARSFPYEVLVQWSGFTDLGNAPGDPATDDGAPGSDAWVGIQVAFREDGTSPWAGTTAADGTDSKSDPVWTAGTSTLHVFPTENRDGDTYETSKHSLLPAMSYTTTSPANRHHVIMDDDSIWMFQDVNDNAEYAGVFIGLYTPRTGLSPSFPLALASVGVDGSSPATFDIGLFDHRTGLVHPDSSKGIIKYTIDRVSQVFTSTHQPNGNFSTPQYDEIPVHLFLNESPETGYVGRLEDTREAFGMASIDTNTALTTIFLGANSTTTTMKFTMPWDGSTTPGSGATRGVDFTRAP